MRLAFGFIFALIICQAFGENAQVWTTTLDKSQLLERDADISFTDTASTAQISVALNAAIRYQNIDGFGAALSDSSAWLYHQLKLKNPALAQEILKSLFDAQSGAGFTMLRVTASASDFSLTNYTYDDFIGDTELRHLSIQHDKEYIIPTLKDILAINPNVKLLFSPWSAPAWMKTSGSLITGTLRNDMYDVLARFFVGFLQQYKAEGISIDYITLQNEPHFEPTGYPGMYLSYLNETTLSILLGPKLQEAGIKTKILVWDHNWDVPIYPIAVMSDPTANPYVAGAAFHCYAGDVSAQSKVHQAFPDKEIHMTECSGGDWAPNFGDDLVWNTQNLYAGNLANWGQSGMHWNLFLDPQDGPTNHGCLNCRAVVTLDLSNPLNAATYNVEYYGMAQFSKFLRFDPEPAKRIHATVVAGDFSSCFSVSPFRNADGSAGAVVLNSCTSPVSVKMSYDPSGQGSAKYLSFTAKLGVTTFFWEKPSWA